MDDAKKGDFAARIREHVLMHDPSAVYNVIPVNDEREHREGTDCECLPTVIEVAPSGAVIVHNAWDGREAYE